MCVLAIDIGGTQYRFALVDKQGSIITAKREATQRDKGANWLAPRIVAGAKELLAASGLTPRAIGVGFGGPVDFKAQKILASLHAPGWENQDLGRLLKTEIDLPCVIDNDANAGALGEHTYGAGKSYQNMLYYTVSTGVGGGVIIEGSLFRGAHGQAGELGHFPIQLNGPPCTCGYRGCVESLCSGLAIAKQAIEASQEQDNSLLSRLYQSRQTLTAKDVFESADQGDTLATQLVEDVKTAFVSGLVGAINFFDPEAVIIGGGVGRAPRFLKGLTERVSDLVVIPGRRQIPIIKSNLGDDTVLLGAAALAWESLLHT